MGSLRAITIAQRALYNQHTTR